MAETPGVCRAVRKQVAPAENDLNSARLADTAGKPRPGRGATSCSHPCRPRSTNSACRAKSGRRSFLNAFNMSLPNPP